MNKTIMHERRAYNAALHKSESEDVAVHNGMTREQAELVSEMCTLRHELHCNIERLAESCEGGLLRKIDQLNERINESGLQGVQFSADNGEVAMIDDIDSLMSYADDIPQDHDSAEYTAWYYENHYRIICELLQANNEIEWWLKDIDERYHTQFCPTGQQRIY